MADLLATIQSLLSGDAAGTVASRLGENQGSVQKALGGIVPMVLGGLINRAETPGGAQAALDLSQQAYKSNPTPGLALGQLEGGSTEPSWLGTLFGGAVSTTAIAGVISKFAGVSPDSAASLLRVAGPAVLGVLGQQAAGGNLNANGFASLLQGLKGKVEAMLPAGLAPLLGTLGLGSAVGGLGSAATNLAGNTLKAVPTAALPAAGGSSRWWLWLLAALAVAAAVYYFTTRNNAPAPTTEAAAAAPADTTAAASVSSDLDSLTKAAPAAAPAKTDSAEAALTAGWAKLGAMGELKLADGSTIQVPANGVEHRLVAFLDDKSKLVDKTTWFSLDRLLFHTGTSTLLPASQQQLGNVVAILKAYPAVKLKLGGYTDDRGNAAMNLKLSGERAAAIKAQVAAAGIEAARLESEGYGKEHPIASNATAEGRQQNRRVDVRVTAK